MKYTVTDKLSETLSEVKLSDGTRCWLETLRFPEDQKDLFDLLQQGMSMPEAEDHCLQRCKARQKELDLLQLTRDDTHIARPLEYAVSRIPGGTGWQIEILKPRRMPLSVLRRYHTLTPAEEETLVEQLIDALQEAKKARLELSRVREDNVFLDAENQFVLDGFNGLGDRETVEDLADLVQDPALRESLSERKLF